MHFAAISRKAAGGFVETHDGALALVRKDSGDLQVDLVRRLVKLGENEVKLSPREYDILRTLVRHAGRVLTHQALLRKVWGGIADVQNLRVHVRQLRQKIEPDPEQPRYILTETGVGYRLRAPE